MIRPDMIPDEVVKAASREYELYIYDAVSADGIRLAIAAAINAWPQSYSLAENDSAEIRNVAVIILPLPEEAGDETVP